MKTWLNDDTLVFVWQCRKHLAEYRATTPNELRHFGIPLCPKCDKAMVYHHTEERHEQKN